uniref:Uncharacterized protein n=1 Tax=Glossina morsitans morsitans TaxID=37546 RepID=A0A1B0G094_GLOMM
MAYCSKLRAMVLFLLGAVACYKFVMGFYLDFEIETQFIGILVFALDAVCGKSVSMLLVDIPNSRFATVLPVKLYRQIIPGSWHQNANGNAAGSAQFLAIVTDFVIMCIINFYLNACIVLLSIRRFCVWAPPEEAPLLVDDVPPEVDEAAATVVALAKPADEEIA